MLKLPVGQNRPLPYFITLVPPLILSLLDPEIFFKALDFAGTYGGICFYSIIHWVIFGRFRYNNINSFVCILELWNWYTMSLVTRNIATEMCSPVKLHFIRSLLNEVDPTCFSSMIFDIFKVLTDSSMFLFFPKIMVLQYWSCLESFLLQCPGQIDIRNHLSLRIYPCWFLEENSPSHL